MAMHFGSHEEHCSSHTVKLNQIFIRKVTQIITAPSYRWLQDAIDKVR